MTLKKALILGGAGIGLAVLVYADSTWFTNSPDSMDDKLAALANIQPGLGTVMIEYSNRFTNVYYAAQGGNWGMAAYQLKEMPEIQEVAETTRPGRKEALQGFEHSALAALAKDIVNQDLAGFNADFKTATAFCNACHDATGFGYIQYSLPDKPPAPAMMKVNMTFTADQLSNILSALLAGN
jgi:hypothetical protein